MTTISSAPNSVHPVSLCMIVRNEAATLPACLASIADLVAERIVIDTGSTDQTKDIARRFGARVFDFQWVDSFAAARNESLRHATQPWILWLDADESLDDANRRKLVNVLASLDATNVAYVMQQWSPGRLPGESGLLVDHLRLFPNHPALRWRYRVHEQILPADGRGIVLRWTDVVIRHFGFDDPAQNVRKHVRNRILLEQDHAEHPNDPFILFNLGTVHLHQGHPREALPFLQRTLTVADPAAAYVRKLYAEIVTCHRQLNQRCEALASCQAGREHFVHDPELLFLEGVLLQEAGDRAAAESRFRQLLDSPHERYFGAVDPGLRGYRARHQLAAIAFAQQRPADAEGLWRSVVEEQSGFLPAWLGLGELFLSLRNWKKLDEVVGQLKSNGRGSLEGCMLRARGHLARSEFRAGRRLLEATIARHPRALPPRIVLGYLLLKEGRDLVAAEHALRAILALDPNHGEARRYLQMLRSRNKNPSR